jgi:hypothetical protein
MISTHACSTLNSLSHLAALMKAIMTTMTLLRLMQHPTEGGNLSTALLHPPLVGANLLHHLHRLRATAPAPVAPPAAPSCLASFVDLMVILLHGAIAASNRLFLALVTMVKETSVKFLWRLLRDSLRPILLMFLGISIQGQLST